ncbi:RNA polymerase II transcription factor B subunit 3 [Penicillium ucsense]|uniref:RNA polymerase II transcription factor B subunit 3 n=1 Tax=Penicillium ucsense TaxID=2839758 RepID=A0A8J8W0R0_9EURO|nr:RNA polymerase II transcription factor B subunit 3 [Penicillium ucsense]KAF7732935.1 RNA polymerase II transcription factor B subunit 3 [Penicillium ucsense]
MASKNGIDRQDEDEVCPVCKSSRYLNPNMRFLINPECYHKMCESCVDRIFSSGPASCPVAGCRKTLRKNRFRQQTFEDIGVEREVDIRRRVMHILNRREEEFDSKRAYDDFLEQREEIIANLVCRTDVAKTEAQLQAYAQENMQSIKANQLLEEQEATSFQKKILMEQEEARLRQQMAREEYENERREQQATREDFLTRLASGSSVDAAALAREGNKVHLKKSSARRSEEERIRQKQAALRGSEGKRTGTPLTTADTAGAVAGAGFIKGLRKIKTPEPEKPYDPFMGLVPGKRDYYTQLESYPYAFLDKLRADTTVQAGGYALQEYYSRTLLEAFAGLGCFVQEEVAERDATSALGLSKPASTEGAAMAAVGEKAA